MERTKLLVFVVDINGFQLNPKYKFRSCLDTVVLLNKVCVLPIVLFIIQLSDNDTDWTHCNYSYYVLQELELYRKELLDKPAVLVINKMDTQGSNEKYLEIKDQLENLDGRYIVLCSNCR